jgi:hypothetical protein
MACIQPLTLIDRVVPCGKCHNCKLRRVNQWVLRLSEEQKNWPVAYFITLTYENETNDKDTDTARLTPNQRRTLIKRDIQLYFKRVRKFSKVYGGHTFKYYAVGEYGAKSGRPHYHAIVFGAEEIYLRTKWLHGFVHVGTVTSSSIAYCLKYISKGRIVPTDPTDDRQKEFSLFSKGLGASYLTPAMYQWHRADPVLRNYAIRPGGFKYPLPRYYRQRLFDSEQNEQIKVHYETEYIKKMTELFMPMHPSQYYAWKKMQAEIIAGSYRRMDYLATQNEKF